MKIVIFDVETKKTFDEVGGYHPEKLGVSLAGVWYGEEESEGKYVAYREEELPELFRLFERADRVIGFNTIGFDYPALKPYYPGNFSELPSLDIMAEVEKDVGHRVSLDAIAKETLEIQKSGHGLDAIKYYREEDWESLEKYCLQDVKVTKEIYDYGKKNGILHFKNKWNRIIEARVDFSQVEGQEKKVQTTLF